MNTGELRNVIEQFAPENLQEPWDNSGYNVDLANGEIRGVFVCLDVTAELIKEASHRGCDVIITHHPLLFRSVKQIASRTYQGKCLELLMRSGISLYCAHTSMDSSPEGINYWLADRFGLENVKALQPASVPAYKVIVTVPPECAGDIRAAAFAAGAGTLGRYADCSFSSRGVGTFRPLRGSHPFLGSEGALTQTEEERIEFLAPERTLQNVLRALRGAHPYETPVIDVLRLENVSADGAGLGCIGRLPEAAALGSFAEHTASALETGGVRFSGEPGRLVRNVAICGGAAGDLAAQAASQGADVLLTGEVKHNQYYESPIPLVEAGHYATEQCFVPAMAAALQKRLSNLYYKVGIFVPQSMKSPYTVVGGG